MNKEIISEDFVPKSYVRLYEDIKEKYDELIDHMAKFQVNR